MRANRVSGVLKWLYFGVLVAATGVGAWKAYPLVEQRRAPAPALAVEVNSHAFLPIFRDTPLGPGHSPIDNFFAPDTFSDAVTAFLKDHPAPKGADSEAWQRELASSMTTSANDYMGRKYLDAQERIGVTNDAKGAVLVRIENTSAAPVDEIRLEVTGAQMFFEGPAAASKMRSLGTRAMRVGTLKPGEKTALLAFTTEDMTPGGEGPHVKVSAKDQPSFPVVVHVQDAPLRPTAEDAGWIAFATLYVALILAGLGVKLLALMGVRFAVVTPEKKLAPAAAASAVFTMPAPKPALAPLTADQAQAWKRPNAV